VQQVQATVDSPLSDAIDAPLNRTQSRANISALSTAPVHQTTVQLGNVESPVSALLKQWFIPAVVLLMLLICILVWHEPSAPKYWALGVAALLISRLIFRPLQLRLTNSPEPSKTDLPRMLGTSSLAPMRWASSSRAVSRRMSARAPSWAFRLPQPRSLPEAPGSKSPASARMSARSCGSHAVNAIYIALPMSNAPRIEEMLREFRDTTASIYFVPDIFAFDLVQARCVEMNGIPMLSICDTPVPRHECRQEAGDRYRAGSSLALLLRGH
jgi:hypothetical protein